MCTCNTYLHIQYICICICLCMCPLHCSQVTPGCCSTAGPRGTQSSIPYRKPREIWHRAHDKNPHTSGRAPERQQLADPRAKGNYPQEQMGSGGTLQNDVQIVICFLCSTVLGVRVHPNHSEHLLS